MSVIGGVKVGAFQAVVDCVFVFFGYVEYERSQPSVAVVVVLAMDGCSADGDDNACGCFADFYG